MPPKRKQEKVPKAVVSAMTAKPFQERNSVEQMAVRYRMLKEFRAGHSAKKATENISDIFGENTINYQTCARWFQKFRAGKTNLVDGNSRVIAQSQAEANRHFRDWVREARALHNQVMKVYTANKK
ncbi:histone-lysine N-methyltransferase SETMAR-like [Ditylenchus destructor]|uniref:Histone-lysine N-methyltransferase SETMAR-like n=1 Tax=Ditylenchus destructor TaxID=166010 RepID=A0AAD4MSX8_9BILA|nr:histone-lysine N-methyltransferase SETMAR-like [Ditylenchus destructor]